MNFFFVGKIFSSFNNGGHSQVSSYLRTIVSRSLPNFFQDSFLGAFAPSAVLMLVLMKPAALRTMPVLALLAHDGSREQSMSPGRTGDRKLRKGSGPTAARRREARSPLLLMEV